MFVVIFSLVVLVACWWVGDQTLLTKLALTLLFLASFALLLIPDYPFLFLVAQVVLILVIGGWTFGPEWLMKRK